MGSAHHQHSFDDDSSEEDDSHVPLLKPPRLDPAEPAMAMVKADTHDDVGPEPASGEPAAARPDVQETQTRDVARRAFHGGLALFLQRCRSSVAPDGRLKAPAALLPPRLDAEDTEPKPRLLRAGAMEFFDEREETSTTLRADPQHSAAQRKMIVTQPGAEAFPRGSQRQMLAPQAGDAEDSSSDDRGPAGATSPPQRSLPVPTIEDSHSDDVSDQIPTLPEAGSSTHFDQGYSQWGAARPGIGGPVASSSHVHSGAFGSVPGGGPLSTDLMRTMQSGTSFEEDAVQSFGSRSDGTAKQGERPGTAPMHRQEVTEIESFGDSEDSQPFATLDRLQREVVQPSGARIMGPSPSAEVRSSLPSGTSTEEEPRKNVIDVTAVQGFDSDDLAAESFSDD